MMADSSMQHIKRMADVSNQIEFYPTGIAPSQFESLSQCADQAAVISPDQLLEEANLHLEKTKKAYSANRMINVRLAAAIVGVIESVTNDWGSISANHRFWLAGAIHYFANGDDDEPDFDSPLGFEDDAEVLNACLQLAGLNKLCLNVEDYDDV